MDKPNLDDVAGAFQLATATGNAELVPLGEATAPSGKQRACFLFTGTNRVDASNRDKDGFIIELMAALHGDSGYRDRVVDAAFAMRSQQQPLDRSHRGIFMRAADVIEPEFDPTVLVRIYHDDPDFRGAVDARAMAVAGLGWNVAQKQYVENPDQDQRMALHDLLDHLGGEYSLPQVLVSTYRDMLVVGTGFYEVARSKAGKNAGHLEEIAYARSLVTRFGSDDKTYYQLHGKKATVFRKLGALAETPVALTLPPRKSLGPAFGMPVGWLSVDEKRELDRGERELRIEFAHLFETQEHYEPAQARLTVTNEMTHVAWPAMNDSRYGTPPVINAIRDWAANRYIRTMNLNFFDNNTIPPLLVTVSAEELAPDTVENIQEALKRQRGREAFHKVQFLELPSGAELTLHPLSQILPEEGAFQKLLSLSSATIHKSIRTPRTMTEVLEGVGGPVAEEANRWFLELTVCPDQALLEHRLNWMIREFAGITDWVVKLRVLNLQDARQQAELDEIYLRGAVYCPNDILKRMGLPPKEGGEYATKTIPGVGVILLEAVRAISERVLEGRGLRESSGMVPRGAKTPSSEAPVVQAPAEMAEPPEPLEPVAAPAEQAQDLIAALLTESERAAGDPREPS